MKPSIYDRLTPEELARFRGRSHEEYRALLEGVLTQGVIGLLTQCSQSKVSRHSKGGVGLLKNREYQREYNRRTRAMKQMKLTQEEEIRLFSERLALDLSKAFAPLVLSLCESLDDLADVVHDAAHTVESSNKSVAVKLDALNNIAKTRR